jgi:hypothetical protein
MFGPLGPSLAPYVRSSRTLSNGSSPLPPGTPTLPAIAKLVLSTMTFVRLNPTTPNSAHCQSCGSPGCGIANAHNSSFSTVVEERPDVQRVRWCVFVLRRISLNHDVSPQAISRLTPREAYDRAFRFKRASQASVLHKDLPQSEWTKPEEVCLSSHIAFYPRPTSDFLSVFVGCSVFETSRS